MIMFSGRLELIKAFDEWRAKESAELNGACVPRDPASFLVFLDTNELLNEEKVVELLERRKKQCVKTAQMLSMTL